MEEALSFFRAFEVWIYVLLGLGGLYFIRKFILAWQELREAAFGLEREHAQARLNQSASALVLVLAMAISEFVLVSFVAPTVPGATPLLTPMLNLLATPTTTLSPLTPQAVGGDLLTRDDLGTPPADNQNAANECMPGKIEIQYPQPGQEVSGVVPITGTVSIENFGHYIFEMKRPDEGENLWVTLQAGNEAKQAASLGFWDTRRLSPGEYQLGLVVYDNQAQPAPTCVVQVRVVRDPDGDSSP
jgi:hypothetical protein